MRIAQVAPLLESVPPRMYGGTERVVSDLTNELVRQRHSVTLFASGDSRTSARLVPVCPVGLRLGGCGDSTAWHLLLVEVVARRAVEFDVIHFHVGPLHFPVMRRLGLPHVTTQHGRLDLPEADAIFREFADMPVVAISDAQRRPVPHANWLGTVHNGLPPERFRFQRESRGPLAFLGRISPEKRVDRAIAIARACGLPIRIAAKVDPVDEHYFRTEVRPLLDHPLVEFIGEIKEEEKSDFLGNARALLFPIDWPEPFGLVMIEALACGTPVVAYRGGSVEEVVEDGVTGWIVDDLDQAVEATRRVDRIDRRACRGSFEQRFNATRMAKQYVALYERVIARESTIAIA